MSAPSGHTLPAPGTVTMFSTTWCGYCRRLKSQMEREGIAFNAAGYVELAKAHRAAHQETRQEG